MLLILVLAVLAGSRFAHAEGSNEEFTCSDSTSINGALKCDGKKDCADGSDETFVACHASTCGKDYLFRCNYGGCVDKTKQCDGVKDCWDNSDENKFLCANETSINVLLDELRGDCEQPYGLSCEVKSKKICLRWSQICDGVIDCFNEIDEKNEICSSALCPAKSFRCQNGACIQEKNFCNRQVDCADGSDEIPEICNPPPILEKNPVTLPADKNSIETKVPPKHNVWKKSGCKLPQQTGMYATDYFTDVSYKPNSEVPMRTVVVVNCREGYENFNSGINRCVGNDDNQEWADLFRCVRLCDQSPMIRNHRYSTQCIGNSGLTDCKTDTHILDTELRVTCAPGFEAYNDTNQMGKHICDDDGSWRTKEVNPKCEAICGIKSKHHPNVTPWKVSLFERASAPDSTYNFKCSGTILSPYVVLTAISCFDGRPKEDDGRSYYSVIEGDYNVSYKESDEHGYLIHFIADINTVTHPESKVPQAALIILVKPFQFGAKVRPICFDTSVSEENVALESPGDFSEFKKGESVVKGPVNDKYYSLTHLVVSNAMSYNVEAFAKAINETIQNSENIF